MEPARFRSMIDGLLEIDDHQMEGLSDPRHQRDATVHFVWGHDHDFGDFQLQGAMGSRHIRHIAELIDRFEAIPLDLTGCRCLDIGCWTGGCSLLMSAMGAEVVAVDEVRKYTECLALLAQAFSLDNLSVDCRSLYDLDGPGYDDRFDYVLLAGVLYHVTDPVVALRIVFNCLKDGGRCLIETTGIRSRKAILSFERRRWNWFDPSPAALEQLLEDVGFTDIRVGRVTPDDRLYAVARRERHVEMRRDGLSRPRLR
jgi:2-polyprenyl-3-methyl-5-hydroxy-6-metoxy-1,4-benzoquinol methylase